MEKRKVILLSFSLILTILWLELSSAVAREEVRTATPEVFLTNEQEQYCVATIEISWKKSLSSKARESIFFNILQKIGNRLAARNFNMVKVDFLAFSEFGTQWWGDCGQEQSWLEKNLNDVFVFSRAWTGYEASVDGKKAKISKVTYSNNSPVVANYADFDFTDFLTAFYSMQSKYELSECVVKITFEPEPWRSDPFSDPYKTDILMTSYLEFGKDLFHFPILTFLGSRMARRPGLPGPNEDIRFIVFNNLCEERETLTRRLIEWSIASVGIPIDIPSYTIETENIADEMLKPFGFKDRAN